MSTPKTPTTTTQIQKTELPAWVDAASQENYKFAEQVANRPFEQYTGSRVAGLDPREQQAGAYLDTGSNNSGALYNAATNYFGRAGEFTPNMVTAPGADSVSKVSMPGAVGNVAAPGAVSNVQARSFLDANLDGYMSPYTQSVIDATRASSLRDESTSLQKNADANRASGSWGGSRDAISNAVIQSEGIRNRAASEAGLRDTAFTRAQSAIQNDNQSFLQAALANQQKDITGNAQGLQAALSNQQKDITGNAQRLSAETSNQNAGLNLAGLNLDAQKANQAAQQFGATLGLQAGNSLASLGSNATADAGKYALLSAQLGQNNRGVAQAGLDANKAMFDERYQAPLDQLNTRLAALGMSPYGKSTASTSTQTGGTSSNTGLQVLGGAMSILPFLFSDRDVKKDVKRVGKVEGTDLNKYEYKYKKGFMGRDMDEPAIGLMADDVRKKVPDAVKSVKVRGKSVDVVDYGKALAKAKPRPFMGRAA